MKFIDNFEIFVKSWHHFSNSHDKAFNQVGHEGFQGNTSEGGHRILKASCEEEGTVVVIFVIKFDIDGDA